MSLPLVPLELASDYNDLNIILTTESPVQSLDSPQDLTVASFLNHAGRCPSGPELLDGRGWISELRPESHH